MSSHPVYSKEPTQIIEAQYVDQRKLMRLLKDVYGTSDEGKNNFHVKASSFHVQRSNLYQPDRFAAKIKPVQNLSVGACQRRPHAHQGTTHLPEHIGKRKLNLNRTKSR